MRFKVWVARGCFGNIFFNEAPCGIKNRLGRAIAHLKMNQFRGTVPFFKIVKIIEGGPLKPKNGLAFISNNDGGLSR